MRKLLIVLFLCSFLGCSGNKVLFDTDPAYLEPVSVLYTLGAHSTILQQESVLTFYDQEHAEYEEYGIFAVHDEEHRDEGSFEMYYDQFRELEYIDVQVRNEAGEIVGTYTIKDADDYSASGSNFFSDVRVKVIEAHHYTYPYTIEYKYKYRYSGTLNLPSWYPKTFSQSVANASFEIIDHTKGNVRYFTRNIDAEPSVREYPEYTSTKWELDIELAQQREVYSPPASEVLPNVITSASTFKVGKSTGNAASWESFGKWYYQLSDGKRELPDAAKQEIDEILAKAGSEKEKVTTLYKYMQDQVRYVSIQLGLGGWEPYPATFVYENKYGDCKALVNFMHAILEYAGVKAEPVLIRTGLGSPEVVADFPSNQFNHVVLKVTLENGEKMWLECTSKYIKPGRIGASNEGKNALVVSNDGGTMVTTSVSEAKENEARREVQLSLQEDGSALIHSILKNKGTMDDAMLHQLKPLSEKKREDWLKESITLNDFTLDAYEFEGLEGEQAETGYKLTMKVNDYASTTPKRLFVSVNKLNQWKVYIPNEEERATALRLPYKFTEIDSSIVELPEGYTIEAMPENVQIDNHFGSFRLSLTEAEGKILVARELQITQRDIKEEEYENFKTFFSTINKADQSQFVVVKE